MSTLPQFYPRRELGRTGFMATGLGIGDLADRNLLLETCVATLRRALDCGLNLVDTAPGYEDGFSEQIVGEAVKGLSQARGFLLQGGIDLLLLDLTLQKGEDGLRLLQEPPGKICPVLLFTAQDESEMYGEGWEKLWQHHAAE